MSTRPDPPTASLSTWRLRGGLILIGLGTIVDRVATGGPASAGGSCLAVLCGLLLIGLAARPSAAAPDPHRSDAPEPPPRPTPDELLARLAAARQVNDADRVLEIHRELAAASDPTARDELRRETLGWLMTLIQRRLRAGVVGPELVQLAERVATEFADHPSGASLRASLPTLRRAAGLCPRCGRAYTGPQDACPACLGRA